MDEFKFGCRTPRIYSLGPKPGQCGRVFIKSFPHPLLDPRFLLSSYGYVLPEERIAQTAAHPPESARLLVCRRTDAGRSHAVFADLPDLMADDAKKRAIFFNDTRVIPARVAFSEGRFSEPDGSQKHAEGEVFFLKEAQNGEFDAMVFPGKRFKIGTVVEIGRFVLRVESAIPEGRRLSFLEGDTKSFLAEMGRLPLPPYVDYSDEKAPDYQTAFARVDGSLAAPTASLHFSQPLLSKLRSKGVEERFLTLHVGLGTFKSVKVPDLRDHAMHPEYFEVPVRTYAEIAAFKRDGRRIVGVGTTVVRTLESLAYFWSFVRHRFALDPETLAFWDAEARDLPEERPVEFLSEDALTLAGTTSLFIMPGFRFRAVDEIVTNFHLPESTLVVLVSSFLWMDETRSAYAEAIRENYRFYSFGDGMWIQG